MTRITTRTHNTVLAATAFLAAAMPLSAQEAAQFAAPAAHPIERYEATWQRNPFVQKTAPVIEERVSFARDWNIVGCYGAENDPIVVLMHTKTRERLRLKKGELASNGMSLHSVLFTPSLKNTVAEVTMGNARAMVKFDEASLRLSKAQGHAQKKSQVAAGHHASDGAGGTPPASMVAPVASVPRDEGSGFPYTYGNSDEKRSVASAGEPSQGEGRKRLLTSQKPVGGGR